MIKSYNNSTSYALGVALLGDAILGRGRPAGDLADPRSPTLGVARSANCKRGCKKLGYDVGEIDGRAGETFRAAVRDFQEKRGLPPDGYATLALLKSFKARSTS